MSTRRKRVDPRVIGLFVVGAVILSVAALVFFGPGGVLAETRSYVVFFDSSVKGLNIGSPVRFRGVKIGQVREINVRIRPRDFAFNVPVVIEIEPSRIKAEGTQQGLLDSLKSTVQGKDPMLSLVDKGLRARLELESLVTGQLYVNFDMLPEAPLTLTENASEYPELPSISSSLEELSKTVEGLPLQELAEKLVRTVDNLDKLVSSPGLHRALGSLDESTAHLNQLLGAMNEKVLPLAAPLETFLQQSGQTMARIDDQIEPLSTQAIQTLERLNRTIEHIDERIDPVSTQLEKSLSDFQSTSAKAIETLTQFDQLAASDSRIMEQLSVTLEEVNRTARTIRYLADQIEQDPQMLLRGRSQGETE